MKNHFLLVLILVLSIASCKNDPKIATPPALQNQNLDDTQTVDEVEFTNPLNKLLFEDYLTIKGAMVNTNSTQTETAAQKLVADFSHKTTYERVKQIAALISSTNDIHKQREFFVGLTNETTKILEADIKSGKIHQQFCPMAFNGKGGYWLSNSKEIRNPYFGDQMLACGEVTKVFK